MLVLHLHLCVVGGETGGTYKVVLWVRAFCVPVQGGLKSKGPCILPVATEISDNLGCFFPVSCGPVASKGMALLSDRVPGQSAYYHPELLGKTFGGWGWVKIFLLQISKLPLFLLGQAENQLTY